MNSISIASTIAMAVGLAAAFPQIVRMLSSRSANGQSIVGWGMGLVANGAMAYVNLAGFGAVLLAASNALSGTLCVVAMLLIARFGHGADGAVEAAASVESQAARSADAAREARAARVAGRTPAGVMIALILLGLGWSAATVAGAALLTESSTVTMRPRRQGISDSLMS
ncbi:MAG: hypothetical protein J7513_14345, partial [Solirubrobacteraceae bacterium]|nr:hypothetical protein [Solirubrobacteraceae bacterium]